MVIATYKVEIDWLNDGAFTGTSDDVTANVRGLNFTRGRNYASQLVGRSVSGRANIVLQDVAGTYSPNNTNSAITGNVLPGRAVRISMDPTGDPSFTTKWYGYTDRIIPRPDVRSINTVQVVALGPLAYVNRGNVRVAMQKDVITSTAIGTILDAVGWPAADRELATGQTTMTRYWAGEQRTLNALRTVESTEAGFLYETPDGKIGFQDRHSRFKSPFTTAVGTWTDSSTGTVFYSPVRQLDPLRAVFNEFKASVQLYSTGPGTVLWTHPESGANSPSVDIDETKTFWALFPSGFTTTALGDFSDGEAIAVDSWTDMTSGVDWVANSQAGGGGTNLTAAMKVTESKFATAMLLEIQNTGTQEAFLTTLQAKGVALFRHDPVTMSAADATSQTAFGERTFTNASRFVPNTDEADSWARLNLSIYKDPLPIASVTIIANRSSAMMKEVTDRDISDRVRLEATGSVGLGLDEDFFIENERHTVTTRRTHSVEYRLSPASQISGFWVLGVGALGTSTRLAY